MTWASHTAVALTPANKNDFNFDRLANPFMQEIDYVYILGYSAPVQGRSVIFPNMIAFMTPSVYRTIRSNSHNSLYKYFSVGISTRRVIMTKVKSPFISVPNIFSIFRC